MTSQQPPNPAPTPTPAPKPTTAPNPFTSDSAQFSTAEKQKLTSFDSTKLDPIKFDPKAKLSFTEYKGSLRSDGKSDEKKDNTNYLEGDRRKAYMVVTVGKVDPAAKTPDKNLLEKIAAGEEIKTQATGLTLKDVLEGKTDGNRSANSTTESNPSSATNSSPNPTPKPTPQPNPKP